jgi:hypothetical protein
MKVAEIYARYVRAGGKTLDDVPPRWRAQVAQLLKEGEDHVAA